MSITAAEGSELIGLATSAGLNSALGTLSTASNDLYVCSRDGSKVRVVVNSTGVIGTIAGVGTPGCVTAAEGSELIVEYVIGIILYSSFLLLLRPLFCRTLTKILA